MNTARIHNSARRLMLLLAVVILTVASAGARSKGNTLSEIQNMNPAAYISATGPMLRTGLQFADFGITPRLTSSLEFLELAVVRNSQYFDKARDVAKKVRKDMDEVISIKSPTAGYIMVWATQPKNDIFKKVLIGIGSYGKLTYILMEGEITGQIINEVLRIWQ